MNQILLDRRRETRRYVTNSDYYSVLEDAYNRMAYWYPGQLCGRAPLGTLHQVAAGDFRVPGQGEQVALAEKWNIKLPQDYLDFCSSFQMYTLVGRNGLTIMDARDIEETTQHLREAEEASREDPYCLYRFASVEGSLWHFMFRYSDEGVFQDVAFAAYPASDEWEILGEDESSYLTDHSFSDWLKRMIETDCVPLRRNSRDELSELTQRL